MEDDGNEQPDAIDKVLALSIHKAGGIKEAFGSEPLTQWEEEFIDEMEDRINTMIETLGDTVEVKDADCFSEKQMELIDTIWNKAGQPELED